MLRLSLLCRKSQHHNVLRRGRPHMHRYREMHRWQREAQGLSKWDHSHSHRPMPYAERFNPDGVGLTRGTSADAWRWWHTQQPWLPNTPNRRPLLPPAPHIPPAWGSALTSAVCAMGEAELRGFVRDTLTEVLQRETQRDGYELRRLDFEGKPLSALPETRVLGDFVLEEDTLRARLVREVVEGVFRLHPTSRDWAELRSVAHVTDYILTHVRAARAGETCGVTAHTREVLRGFDLQPEWGFAHALPTDHRDQLLQEWERMHHMDWQFGKAVYAPREREETRGNLTWLREERHEAARRAFVQRVQSGEAKREHMQRIAEAAATEGN